MSNKCRYSPDGIPEPWERQAGEPPKAWEAFTIYRSMPAKERSVQKVGERQGKKWVSYMQDWSAKWRWVDRAAEYDNYLDRQKMEQEAKNRKEMYDMHIKAARAMLGKALKALQSIPAEDMSANDISRMIEVASKLERISRGETTESIEAFGKEGAPPVVQIYIPDNGREND